MTTENKTSEHIDTSRRGFTKLGAAAPVLMTLASRPVFGGGGHGLPAMCLSGMMSGNASHEHELQCRYGWSPGGWANPGGKIAGLPTEDAWLAAGFTHGGGASNDKCPTSGSTVQDMRNDAATIMPPLPAGALAGFLSGSNGSDTLVCVLKPPPNTLDRFCITAYLNAKLLGNYILSPAQVVLMCTGYLDVPGGGSIQDFLDATWNGGL